MVEFICVCGRRAYVTTGNVHIKFLNEVVRLCGEDCPMKGEMEERARAEKNQVRRNITQNMRTNKGGTYSGRDVRERILRRG